MANPDPPKRCIFCDQPGLTKEHLWPNWLKSFLPRQATDHYHVTGSSAVADSKIFASDAQLKRQTGDIRSRRVKVVCRACNHSWMGKLQEAAKPKLVPLHGAWSRLSVYDCEAVSAWAVMFTIIVERLDVSTAAATAAERRAFSLDRRPPANWMIWVGHCKDWPPWDFYHRGWGVFSEGNAVPASTDERCNSQTTTFKVGELLLHTYSTMAPAIDVDPVVFALKHGLCPIWPLTDMPYVAPNQLSPMDVNGIAHDLTSTLGLPVIIPPDAAYHSFTV
jgi:hypothetical protein